MRRVCATWLALLIGFWLMAPAIPAYISSTLPACCRPGGKHHCTMAGTPAPDHGPAFGAAADRCPFAPVVAGSVPNAIGTQPPAALPRPAVRNLARSLAAITAPEDSYSRLFRVRGPPSPLA